jgi:hypothetical protein
MELTITVHRVLQAHPRRYEWIATRPDASRYAGSSESIGSSAQARDEADAAFKDPRITWDWGFTRRATDEPGTAAYRGHVFVDEEAA